MIINISDLIMNIVLHLAYIEKIHTHYSFNALYLLNKVSVVDLVMINWSQYIFNIRDNCILIFLQVYIFLTSIFLVIWGSRNIICNFKMNIGFSHFAV